MKKRDMQHNIPLGSIVEIVFQDSDNDSDTFGLRLFVVQHTRDCDGTPLYGLSFKRKAGEDRAQQERDRFEATQSGDQLSMMIINAASWMTKGSITGGYTEECLKVIK